MKASQLRSHLAEIEAKIGAIESQLAMLRVERETVLERLDAVVYPILNIPPEITSEILLQCIDDPYSRCQLQLASVCREWRSVALSTPALWTGFYASYLRAAARDAGKLLNLLQCWLQRAGNLPLDLKLPLPPGSPPDAILSVIAQYASQWRTVELELIHSKQPIFFPLDSFRGPLHCLRKVVLSKIDSWPNNAPASMTAFLDAPQLREAQLHTIPAFRIRLPWSQLTKLELHEHTLDQCLEFLRLTPNLEAFSAYIARSSHFQRSLPTLITLPRLHTLRLSFGLYSSTLLDNLTLPALDALELSHFDSLHIGSLDSFIVRSGCCVRKARMVDMTYESTYDCICSLESVKDLTIRSLHSSSENLTTLFDEMAESPDILPALESLSFEVCHAEIQVCPLTDMLQARWAGLDGAAKLGFFGLTDSNRDRDNYIDCALWRLSDMRAEGLQLDLNWLPIWSSENMSSQLVSRFYTASR
ncbi:hypothetical protein C8R44DRAFT_22484 [Mycena epipterygia]|nr:hypothetical protein C8R44DRAFT_22484 [Mycena epipterygia]